MNYKFNLNSYEICVSFKSDSVMIIAAEFEPTGEHFLCDSAELIRIKKDTVLATLDRKSERNLKCQIEQFVEEGVKYLTIRFVINFDFLPEFSQEVRLDYVHRSQSVTTLQFNHFKADIEEIERSLDALAQRNGIFQEEVASLTLASGNIQELKTLELIKGRYLLRISGVFTNSTGSSTSEAVEFVIRTPADAKQTSLKMQMHSISGYSYPFAVSHVFSCHEGAVKVSVRSNITSTITNVFVLCSPICDLK